MSSDLIRAFRDEDIPDVARIWRELRPDAMHSEDGLRHLVGSFPERAQAAFWVAEDDGVVAWCFAHRRWHRATENGYIWLGVLPAARGRGVGTALWQLAEQHLGAIGVSTRAVSTATSWPSAVRRPSTPATDWCRTQRSTSMRSSRSSSR